MVALVAAIIALCVQLDYVNRSTGEISGGLTELPYASSKRVNPQFDALIHSLKKSDDTVFVSTSTNVVLVKF